MTTQNRGRNRPNGQCGRSQRQALKPVRTTLIRINVEDPAWAIRCTPPSACARTRKLSSNRLNPHFGSLMTVFCQTPTSFFCPQLINDHTALTSWFASVVFVGPHTQPSRPSRWCRSTPSLGPRTLTRSSTWTFVVQLSLTLYHCVAVQKLPSILTEKLQISP